MPRLTDFALQCYAVGLETPVSEHRFHSTRRWRLDFAWPSLRLAVEVDGGGFIAGRHSRGTGITKDCEKFAEATALGWRIVRVTPAQVRDGSALRWILAAMQWTTVPADPRLAVGSVDPEEDMT